MAKKQSSRWLALRAAFPYTLPIFAGFWFLGLTYGVYMNASGFPFWYPALMSLTIFAGSMEFVAVKFAARPLPPGTGVCGDAARHAAPSLYGFMLEPLQCTA